MTIVEKGRRGRPPAFERGAVLDLAMEVFWASGFEGASIPMLVSAMGISAQSLYAAFGSKDALYREAVARYRETIGRFADVALDKQANVLDAISALLRESAILFSSKDGRPGCMITTAPAGVNEDALTLFGRELRADGVRKLVGRLQRGVDEGQLCKDTDCTAWAHYLSSVLQGMSVQARDGASTEALLSIAAVAAQSLEIIRARHRDRRSSGRLVPGLNT